MFKKILLGGTALVGAAAMTLPANAGQVGSKDAMSVTLGGEFRFIVGFSDQDVSAGYGRGYEFHGDEVEVKINAKNTADNGLEYGVGIELNGGGSDGTAADEAFAFIDSDQWGRVEMGDQDDATDRMHVSSIDILVGRAGSDGDVADFIQFGSANAISAPGVDSTSDDTKLTYFSPRFGGFQVGASLTPDTGVDSGTADLFGETDNDGDFENVFGVAANWEGSFDEVGIIVSAIGEFGDSETASGADTEGEIETFGFGAVLTYAGFGVGGSYVDFAEKGIAQAARAAGADSGSYYDLGVSYSTGPYGISLGWFESSVSNATGSGGDTDVQILSIDASYTVAPGWELAAGLNFVDAENINATAVPVNNEGTLFLISNEFKF
ncbi:MAG: porin [Alphaproteobacteria bacterium]|nr:porin [Alphaproteobacteria bacterium]